MGYSLEQLKKHAYIGLKPENASRDEMVMWSCLRYCYDIFRSGEDKSICEQMMHEFIEKFWKGKME